MDDHTDDHSSIDELLEALRKSGMDVGAIDGSDNAAGGSSSNGDVSSSAGRARGTKESGEKKASSAGRGRTAKESERARSSHRTKKTKDAKVKRTAKSVGSAGGKKAGGSGGFSRFAHDAADFFTGAGAAQGFGGARPDAGDAGNAGGAEPPHIEMGDLFGNHMASWSKRTIVIAIIVVLAILYAVYWWFHPPISINSPETWEFVGILILLPLFVVFASKAASYRKGTGAVEPDLRRSKRARNIAIVPVVIVCVGIVGALLSLSVFPGNAHKYANVLQTEQLDFASDIQEVDYSQIPVIDHDTAELLGNREMGSIPEYVSQFEVSNLYSQINYQGKPVRVSPLNYADLFKWLFNRTEGIPAYVLVDMTTQDAEVVRLGDDAIFYSQSEPLARNIDRYVQLKYPFYIFDEKSFEIDDDGQPWWICPVRTYTIGLFGGETISRVVMVNATTGECTDLSVDEVPQWVDRVYPASLLLRQYNWSGKYQNGWFNSWLGQSGVVQTTPGTDGNPGYNYLAKDDDVWVYTGVTSATSDSSIVGFVLINQRTAESHYYSVSGATEASAMDSAEGQVQNLRYTATFPLLINVANQPTYFMSLKDNAGTVKKFAMVDIQRYQNVAVGDTVADCQKSYEALLAANGTASPSNLSDYKTTSGTIRTMAQAVIDGNTHFYVTLEGDANIYDFVLPAQVNVVSYKVGDAIAFSYVEGQTTDAVQEILSSPAGAANAQQAAVAAASAQDAQAQASSSASQSASAAVGEAQAASAAMGEAAAA